MKTPNQRLLAGRGKQPAPSNVATMPSRLIAAFLFFALPASGGEREYMDVVGRLLGLSQSPSVIQEYCARRSPETSESYRALLTLWTERNSAMLVRINKALDRADEYMRRRDVPQGPRSIAEVLSDVREKARERLEQQSLDEARKFCTGYPAFLGLKEEEFSTEIPRLIEKLEAEEVSARIPSK